MFMYTTILILSSGPAMPTPGTPSLITSQSELLQTTCSSTEQSRLRSSSQTADGKSQTDHPPTLPDIRRVNSIKVLGVCFINHLSMNNHIHDVIGSCGQSLHALEVFRSHGMNDDSLRDIYKTVVLVKLFYASPAWWGFTTAQDRQQIDEFVRRSVQLCLYSTGESEPMQLINSADDALHCLNASYTTRTTCYIHCYLISTQQVIARDSDATTESYLRRLVACRVITF